jgi:hypothetical protein
MPLLAPVTTTVRPEKEGRSVAVQRDEVMDTKVGSVYIVVNANIELVARLLVRSAEIRGRLLQEGSDGGGDAAVSPW